ncbi:MAG TPA: hypothetical protein ENG95_04205 [Nitrospirae bacterium]|nr:hypothetical protein BMS3Abin10_00768 [bacterium BMS3Abin10]GBE39846.1 hypothetical protein BMS3Bbin08_02478 [bacterium BMS3Bbin08]HDO25828.1 hypothetical protein [Nitrospirota bacterium]
MTFEKFVLEISGLLSILIGLIIIIGVKQKWRFFVNPPDHIWIFPIWPYAVMKGTSSEKFIPTYNLICGIMGVIIGVLFMKIEL